MIMRHFQHLTKVKPLQVTTPSQKEVNITYSSNKEPKANLNIQIISLSHVQTVHWEKPKQQHPIRKVLISLHCSSHWYRISAFTSQFDLCPCVTGAFISESRFNICGDLQNLVTLTTLFRTNQQSGDQLPVAGHQAETQNVKTRSETWTTGTSWWQIHIVRSPSPPQAHSILNHPFTAYISLKCSVFSFLLKKKLMLRWSVDMFGWRQHGASREQNNIETAVPSPPTWRRYWCLLWRHKGHEQTGQGTEAGLYFSIVFTDSRATF